MFCIGHRQIFSKYDVFQSLGCANRKQTLQTLMNEAFMLHFIWVFIVCLSTCTGLEYTKGE